MFIVWLETIHLHLQSQMINLNYQGQQFLINLGILVRPSHELNQSQPMLQSSHSRELLSLLTPHELFHQLYIQIFMDFSIFLLVYLLPNFFYQVLFLLLRLFCLVLVHLLYMQILIYLEFRHVHPIIALLF